MTRPLSLDLRRRVVAAIDQGLSTAQAAERFAIGKSTAGAWHRLWRATGDVFPGRQGNPGGSILDPYEAFLLDLIEETKDIALHEMAERLEVEHGLKTHPSTIWYFLDRRGITLDRKSVV